MNKAIETSIEKPKGIDALEGYVSYDPINKKLVLENTRYIDHNIVNFKDDIYVLVIKQHQDMHLQAGIKFLTSLREVYIEGGNMHLFPLEFRNLPDLKIISITDSPLEKVWPDSIPYSVIDLILDNNPNLVLPFLKKNDRPIEKISAINSNITLGDVRDRISDRIQVVLNNI